jgi:photosystem II stability/assembly factor-like uncharacterized protein
MKFFSARSLAGAACAVLGLLSVGPVLAADTWVPLGPNGGTVSALAIDPQDGNTVYAGTREAGAYRSANGGRTWQPAGLDGGIVLLTVAPGNRDVYAVAGTISRTLYRSEDGGASWASLADGLAAAGRVPSVDALAPSTAPGTLYALSARAVSLELDVLKSTDGGDSWRIAWTPPADVSLFGVYTDPTDPRYVYAGTSRGVYTSADGGGTWSAGTPLADVTQLGVENGPRHRLLAGVSNGNPRAPQTLIYASSDRGRTWRLRDGLQGEPLLFLLGDPTAPGAFYAIGSRGTLERTTDAGLHWTHAAVPHPSPYEPVLALALDPARPGVGYVALAGISLGRTVWKTASFGAAWIPLIRGLFAGDFASLTVDPGNSATLWAVGTPLTETPRGLWRSADRGATWAAAGFNAADVDALTIAGTAHNLFVDVLGQGLLRSTDGGQHWQPVLPTENARALVSVPQAPDTLYVLTTTTPGGSVLDKSQDGGTTWTSQPLAVGIFTVAASSPTTFYANGTTSGVVGPAGDDSVQRSTDGGATWTTILRVTGGTVTSIGTDPVDPQRIVVAHGQLDADSLVTTELLFTADGGATWQVGNLPVAASSQDAAVLNLLPDPLTPHGFLAGTASGAFASADGGATWTPLGAGLPRIVTRLSLDPSSPGTVYAATQGGGIYRLERTTP